MNQNEIHKMVSNVNKLYSSANNLTILANEEDESNLDIIQFLNDLSDTISNPSVDLCICERQNVCNCKNECICDNDFYYTTKSRKCSIASNCMYLIDLTCIDNIILSNKTNIRLFTLNNITLEEMPILDIVRTYDPKDKNKKKLLSTDIHILKTEKYPSIIIPLFDGLSIKETDMFIKFNYMLYK